MQSPSSNTEPFPAVDTEAIDANGGDSPPTPLHNGSNTSSSFSGRLRHVSQSFGSSELPEGFSAATGGIASTIFSRQTAPRPRTTSPTGPAAPGDKPHEGDTTKLGESSAEQRTREPPAAAPFPNGYHFPPAHSFGHSTKLGLIAFWKYLITPVGFLVTIYGLNVVAWGGMLFLLLCNACKDPFLGKGAPRRLTRRVNSSGNVLSIM